MDLAQAVEGEDQLYKAPSTIDPMAVGLTPGLPTKTRVVKSPSLGSNNRSRSGFPRTLTMTSKERRTSLELAQTTQTVSKSTRSKRYLGLFLATRESKRQATKCPSGATLKRMNWVTMWMKTSRLMRLMNFGDSISRWTSSGTSRRRTTISRR